MSFSHAKSLPFAVLQVCRSLRTPDPSLFSQTRTPRTPLAVFDKATIFSSLSGHSAMALFGNLYSGFARGVASKDGGQHRSHRPLVCLLFTSSMSVAPLPHSSSLLPPRPFRHLPHGNYNRQPKIPIWPGTNIANSIHVYPFPFFSKRLTSLDYRLTLFRRQRRPRKLQPSSNALHAVRPTHVSTFAET